uniref:Uncharacterized protein n=1 Tax=Glossina austeni TaxID=7395 RepID=A0A1A9UIT6_GLOAU
MLDVAQDLAESTSGVISNPKYSKLTAIEYENISWDSCYYCPCLKFACVSAFVKHLRERHCTREGGSFVCRYGYNGLCPSYRWTEFLIEVMMLIIYVGFYALFIKLGHNLKIVLYSSVIIGICDVDRIQVILISIQPRASSSCICVNFIPKDPIVYNVPDRNNQDDDEDDDDCDAEAGSTEGNY